MDCLIESISGRIMDLLEMFRKLKRSLDGYISYRKAFLIITLVFGFILFLGPSFLRWLTDNKPGRADYIEQCLKEKLGIFHFEASQFDSNIQHIPVREFEKPYIPYIGNGLLGISLDSETPIYIRKGRTLSLPVKFHPVVVVSLEATSYKSAIAVQYVTGTAQRIQCFGGKTGVNVVYQYYAHRKMPSVLVQNIKVTNPSVEDVILELEQMGLADWSVAESETVTIPHGDGNHEYLIMTGMVEVPDSEPKQIIGISIVTQKVLHSIEVKARMSHILHIISAVNYTEPIKAEEFNNRKEAVKLAALQSLRQAVIINPRRLKEEHMDIWRQLWSTGFSISNSKAKDSINGDKINATLYYVLSQVSAPLYEVGTTNEGKMLLYKHLSYTEGCYGGHHTLQAVNLWSQMSTVEDINRLASYWLLTLEKQGCHNLLSAGANGVLQAMVLSFGALKFSNHHLEFDTHPKDLHRDYLFRRVNYGNATHVNITVVVQENNKAALYVALDRSDKNYYACDGGCVDAPVELRPEKTYFPVKLTDPVTAVLYITSDKQHMEELKHTIHVKEIAEAPAHEHHVIALHKHGHHLGGLPAIFWVSISFLIIVFHLFLFKLIYNEYCGTPDKYRSRMI